MTYSINFRRKVLLIKEQEKLTFSEVSERVGVGKARVVRGSNRIEAQSTRNQPATRIDLEKLKPDVQMYPEAYQYERAERVGVSPTGIGAALRRLGITR